MEARNRIDEWLDKGLAEYGNVEPRAGLENRILANLSAEQNLRADRCRWWWPLSTVSVTIVVVISVWLGNRQIEPTENNTARMQSFQRAVEKPTETGTRSRSGKLAKRSVAGDVDSHFNRRKTGNRSKPDQFPSARPLSDQVQLLLGYVNETPRDEIIAVITRKNDSSDLQIRDLEIPPLDRDSPPSESSETN